MAVTSSNTSLLPLANITKSGTAPTCTLNLTPVANQNGTSTVTVSLTDGNGAVVKDQFIFTVTPDNDSPTISNVPDQSTNEDVAKNNVAFTIGDIDSTLTCTGSVTAASSNMTLLPNGNITL